MPRYLIERDIQGAGLMTPAELRSVSQTSCRVLDDLGPQIQWEHSYVAGDKTFCVYTAASEELIHEHAKRSGFPATTVTPVSSIISPDTAKS